MRGRLALACAAAAALTIAPAILEGLYANRWGNPPDFAAAADQLKGFPQEFGAWKFVSDGDPVSEYVARELGLAGYISRSYAHRENGSVVSLLLMVGQSGPLLRHPPNVCYANRANEQVGEMTTFHVETTKPASQFNLLEYRRPQSLTNDRFLVAYSMAASPTWSAPRMPRVEFGGAKKLYKVQLLTLLDPSQDHEKGAAILQGFAADFCAAFQLQLQADGGG